MSEMLIQSPVAKKTLNDYDILFESGMLMPVTIDLEGGDTISFDDNAILVHIAPKPSLTDPKTLTPEEDITVFSKHVASIRHMTREVNELSPEQKEDWKQMWSDLIPHKTVQ